MLLVSRSASSCGRLPVGCLPHALPARLTNAHTALRPARKTRDFERGARQLPKDARGSIK